MDACQQISEVLWQMRSVLIGVQCKQFSTTEVIMLWKVGKDLAFFIGNKACKYIQYSVLQRVSKMNISVYVKIGVVWPMQKKHLPFIDKLEDGGQWVKSQMLICLKWIVG